MVPMHYGTFRLSHEPIEEPLQLLEREALAAGVKDKSGRAGRGHHALLLERATLPGGDDDLASDVGRCSILIHNHKGAEQSS
jgi:hypothetical protein